MVLPAVEPGMIELERMWSQVDTSAVTKVAVASHWDRCAAPGRDYSDIVVGFEGRQVAAYTAAAAAAAAVGLGRFATC